MYLPLSSALLRWLQIFSFSSPRHYSSASHFATPVSDEQLWHHHGSKDLHNLGNLSPYHDAPTVPGVSVDLPNDCAVDQVILLQRHGSRGPLREDHIFELLHKLDIARDLIRAADLPESLRFLKEGYKYQLTPHELTVLGRKELFNHGVQFALRYPMLSTDAVVSTTVQRVKDSTHFFAQGFFGRKADNVTYMTTDDFDDSVSWIKPWEACPKIAHREPTAEQWVSRYIPPIVERFNKLLPGVDFSINAIRGALESCAYDLAARDDSPWCGVFTAHELRGLEYELDLAMDCYTGYSFRRDPGPLLGAFYIQKLVERLTNATGNAQSLYLEFGHETSILLPLATIGLIKDASPLSPIHPPAHRKFRTSNQAPFGGNMVWERFTCKTSFKGPQVRLILNRATFPLSVCEKSRKDKEYGTCSLEEFVRANEHSLNVKYRSKLWNATCEVGH